jgi:hypothetical protein
MRVAVGDVNGDGVDDVITAAGNTLAVALSARGFGPRQSTSMDGSFSKIPGKIEYPNLVGIGDLDGDGRADIVAEVDGTIEFAPVEFTVDGSPPSLGKVSKVDSFTIKQGVNVQLGDVNGDGTVDIIASSKDGVDVGANVGGGRFSWTQVDGPIAISAMWIVVGDLDGDGLDEICAVKRPPYGGHVTVLK